MSWADDFSLQNSTANPIGKPSVKKSPTRKEQLEAELKLLEWHKLANDAAIKAAIMQTKQLKKDIPPRPPTHTAEDSRWMRRVIEQENVKPLEVTKDFVLEYEAKEKENAERLSTQVDRHISTLSNLRKKLEDRNAMKSRTDEYRAWKKDFSVKKQAVMIGRTLDEIEMSNTQNNSTHESLRKGTFNPTLKNGPSQELSNVLDSLSKLAELEKRITSLERDNEYDVLANKDKPSANNRTSFEFRKKRTPLEEGAAVGISFALRQKKAEPPAKRAVPIGTGVSAVRARQQGQSGQGAVFLTNMGDDEDGRYDEEQASFEDRAAALKREKAKALAMSSAGKKAIRSRVVAKKERVKETLMGAQKHEVALKELNKRRHDQLNKKRATRPTGVQVAAKGISTGVKSKNKHMQDFEKMKSGHKKRKEDITRKFKINEAGRGLAGGVDISSSRIASFSAPHKGRVPAVKSGGTTTRRVDNPSRRGGGDHGAMTAPLPSAITGVRALKQLRK